MTASTEVSVLLPRVAEYPKQKKQFAFQGCLYIDQQ